MAKINQPLPWESNSDEPFLPISYEGEVIGFCRSDYASQIVETLNDDDKLRKALYLACYDLVARSGGSTSNINELMQQYIAKATRPRRGTGAIALLLKERQADLDLTDEEFAKFCDTFRLSREELRNIYAGADIENTQLSSLSRILGMTVDEVIEVWRGKEQET
ncbi:MAG: hypothetical protein K6T90_20795 [Leptolyngbyaceae cyanobacterium HOT.MB2.61]|jgi:hypothetical protein|nr:hypothetical protein [Leptolyngbyaceae cyanobacterium HOT.MB2.61]